MREYSNYRAQKHDRIRQVSIEKQERDAEWYDAGISQVSQEINSLVMVYHRWKGPFRVSGPGGIHGLFPSWMDERKIRGTYHGDHLKHFHTREGYLQSSRYFASHRPPVLNGGRRGVSRKLMSGGGKWMRWESERGVTCSYNTWAGYY